MESARIIVFHESIGGEERGHRSFDGDDKTQEEGMHRGNKTNFYVSRKKPIEIVQPLLPSTLLLSPPFHPAHTDASPLLPRVYLTSRYKIHFIATGTTNRYFSFLGTGSQSDKRMTRRLQPAARCNKWI